MKTLIAKLLGLPGWLWEFYGPLLKALFVSGAAALLPIALEVVRELALENLPNSAKRDTAVQRLTAAAVDRGLSVTESIIRFTVESAVQKMKGEK